jgi:hypothetical protein
MEKAAEKATGRKLWILFFLFVVAARPGWGLAPPEFKKAGGVDIVAGQPVYVNSTTNIVVQGTGVPGTTIRLFINNVQVAEDVVNGGGNWSITLGSVAEGAYVFDAEVTDGVETSPRAAADTVIDVTPPAPVSTYAFLINRGEASTATSVVFVSMNMSDTNSVSLAQVSNDEIWWTNWATPTMTPSSYPWEIAATPGTATVAMKFQDRLGNTTTVYRQSIRYYPQYHQLYGTSASLTYPVGMYDEYEGQNKYGLDRSAASGPADGHSLQLEAP